MKHLLQLILFRTWSLFTIDHVLQEAYHIVGCVVMRIERLHASMCPALVWGFCALHGWPDWLSRRFLMTWMGYRVDVACDFVQAIKRMGTVLMDICFYCLHPVGNQ